jgi:hypothetical protein
MATEVVEIGGIFSDNLLSDRTFWLRIFVRNNAPQQVKCCIPY